MSWKIVAFLAAVLACAPAVLAQEQTEGDVEHLAETPIFSVTTVARTTQAVNYRYRRGDTKIDFDGTSLAPIAMGEARVKAKQGAVLVEAEFAGLKPANEFGAEYLTYVLWAITPQGRAVNLGELVVGGDGRAKIETTTELQAFGMVVTAEPYFAVRRPSDLIVAENAVREDTKGEVLPVEAKFELLGRGEYAKLANPLSLTVDLKSFPIDLYQARNAVQIARSLQADTYAEETFAKAAESLDRAEDLAKRRESKKDIATLARQAVQVAEDARELAEKRMEQESLENERAAAAEREASARARADEEAELRVEAEAQRAKEAELREQATQAKTAAEREKLEAELAAAQARAEMEKALREKEQAQRLIAQAQAEAAQAREQQQVAQTATTEMEAERQRLAQAKSEAEEAARAAVREKQELAEMVAGSQAEAEQAKLERGEAVSTADSLRTEREQLAAQKAEAEQTAAQALAAKTEAEQLMAQARTELDEARQEKELALAAKSDAEQAAGSAKEDAQRLESLRARAEN